MRNLTDRIFSSPSRRELLAGLGVAAAGVSLMLPRGARADETPSGEPDAASVLNDPDSGVVGNPQGDIAIVEKAGEELARFHLRLGKDVLAVFQEITH